MPKAATNARVLIFSQTFVPDPAAVGQHITDVAVALARRGHDVRVFTANRGYENPSLRYVPRENLHGVRVRRLPLSSFGKRSILTRLVGTVSFIAQTFVLALFTRRVAGIFFSTSPPMIGVACALAAWIRGVPTAYWAMDLNPDQLIAMGKIGPTSLPARVLERANRFILHRTALIVALDRFMADRLLARGNYAAKLLVLPPWSHEDRLESVERAQNPFRRQHGLTDAFVIMYSGNHSPANPLTTLLQAAVRLKSDPRLRFLFVGGGLGKKEVDATIAEHGLSNALSLPYQPLDQLRYSLPAADVHVVSLGDNMVGIVHPCKIYGAMAVGRPVLFLGPTPSHVSDILAQHDIGWTVAHGDVEACVNTLRDIAAAPPLELVGKGRRAQQVVEERLSQALLCGTLCARLEQTFALPASGRPRQPASTAGGT